MDSTAAQIRKRVSPTRLAISAEMGCDTNWIMVTIPCNQQLAIEQQFALPGSRNRFVCGKAC